MLPTTIYHLARATDWATSANGSGDYRISTLDQSLDDVGFIHCSYAHQLQGTADRFYRDRHDIVVLVIDRNRLQSPVVDEPDAHRDRFPHVYGPINPDAVTEVIPLACRPDGSLHISVGDGESAAP